MVAQSCDKTTTIIGDRRCSMPIWLVHLCLESTQGLTRKTSPKVLLQDRNPTSEKVEMIFLCCQPDLSCRKFSYVQLVCFQGSQARSLMCCHWPSGPLFPSNFHLIWWMWCQCTWSFTEPLHQLADFWLVSGFVIMWILIKRKALRNDLRKSGSCCRFGCHR